MARFPTPKRLWNSSLPFRVVMITMAATVAILLATGWVLLSQSSQGIVAAKTQSAVAEATSVLRSMQDELAAADTRVLSANEVVSRLAREAANRGTVGNQYYVLAQTPVTQIGSAGVSQTSLPADLRNSVTGESGLWSAATTISYTDGRDAEPGLAVAGALESAEGELYPIYFIFPTTAEQQTLAVVQQATIVAAGLLLVAMTVTVYLVAVSVLRPVRAAAVAAERLAGGNLEERLPVKGSSDLASLATSMNFMAAELDLKITELEKISQVQQQFVSDVSHELKTPLTTIQMATSMIDAHRAELEPVAERSAELLSKEVGRFSDLLADLLEVSRFDAGAASLSLDDVDLGKLVSAEVDGVLPLANRAGAEITVAASGEFTAELDRTRVRRILRNLLTNAIEHGEGKPIEVDVGGNDDAVAVTVRDHGVGLDPQQVQQVFTRFWRGDPSRSRQLGGVGLGLAIALEDAKLHGGKLGVWAALEQGACFRLVLPRHPGGEIVPEPLELAPEGEGGSVHEP